MDPIVTEGNQHDGRWEIDRPMPGMVFRGFGMVFRVLEEEWDASVDPPMRIIKRVEIIGTSTEPERAP